MKMIIESGTGFANHTRGDERSLFIKLYYKKTLTDGCKNGAQQKIALSYRAFFINIKWNVETKDLSKSH